jgi:hypothetical protein
MYIMVAGPYSAPTERERRENLDRINRAAAEVAKKGHIPVVGVNAALPVVLAGEFEDDYVEIMRISMALADRSDAILILGKSKGTDMEKSVFDRKGLKVFTDIDEIPQNYGPN